MIYLKSKLGFSMVEALVAIAVLTIGVITPLSMLANSLANADFAKNQITAFFLAQEGQELIINYRDNNRLNLKDGSNPSDPNTYWLDGLDNCIGADRACYIETRRPTDIERCSRGRFEVDESSPFECPFLTIDVKGFYGYNDNQGASKSIFTREIEIIPHVGGTGAGTNYADVKVTIRWQDRQKARTFTLNSVIFR